MYWNLSSAATKRNETLNPAESAQLPACPFVIKNSDLIVAHLENADTSSFCWLVGSRKLSPRRRLFDLFPDDIPLRVGLLTRRRLRWPETSSQVLLFDHVRFLMYLDVVIADIFLVVFVCKRESRPPVPAHSEYFVTFSSLLFSSRLFPFFVFTENKAEKDVHQTVKPKNLRFRIISRSCWFRTSFNRFACLHPSAVTSQCVGPKTGCWAVWPQVLFDEQLSRIFKDASEFWNARDRA